MYWCKPRAACGAVVPVHGRAAGVAKCGAARSGPPSRACLCSHRRVHTLLGAGRRVVVLFACSFGRPGLDRLRSGCVRCVVAVVGRRVCCGLVVCVTVVRRERFVTGGGVAASAVVVVLGAWRRLPVGVLFEAERQRARRTAAAVGAGSRVGEAASRRVAGSS